MHFANIPGKTNFLNCYLKIRSWYFSTTLDTVKLLKTHYLRGEKLPNKANNFLTAFRYVNKQTGKITTIFMHFISNKV